MLKPRNKSPVFVIAHLTLLLVFLYMNFGKRVEDFGWENIVDKEIVENLLENLGFY